MIEQLFGSKTRYKLLKLFFANQNSSFYVREITRKIDEQINSVRRELSNLVSIGIVTHETANNKLYYRVNKEYEHFEPLSHMLGGKKTHSAKDVVLDTTVNKEASEISSIGDVRKAYAMGRFVKDSSIDIDLLIVGDKISTQKLAAFVAKQEQKLGIEVRYVVLKSKEYNYRVSINDRFLHRINSARKNILVDKED